MYKKTYVKNQTEGCSHSQISFPAKNQTSLQTELTGSLFHKNKTALVLLFLSFVLIGIGIYREEAATVLIKSINICLECIGIG